MKIILLLWWLLLLVVLPARAQWQARHGLTSAQYQDTFTELTSQGYRLTWVSGYTLNDDPRFAAIFEKKASPDWVAHHGMSSSEYQTRFDDYTSQGFRLVLVNGYTVLGVDHYVAIWDKSPSGVWVARHGLTGPEYQSAFDSYTTDGYRLTHVSGYSVGGAARYAAIWEKVTGSPAWVARHGMTSDEYQSTFDAYISQGFRLVLVNGYQVGGVVYYVAIWDKSPSGPWVARHGMTSAAYQDEFDNNYYQGYQLRVVSGYNEGLSDRYAAIWENTVMSAADLAAIDAGIATYTGPNNVPGLSLAITQNDRLVFAKGFGVANTSTGRIVTPNSLFRIMSISKSITATAVMLLVQQGRFKIDGRVVDIKAPVFGPGSLTGDRFGRLLPEVIGQQQYEWITNITVENLLEHEAGWGLNSDPEDRLRRMTPAQAVSDTLANVQLAYKPGDQSLYSNFGFLVLGRLVEMFGETDYETYVKNNILGPSGVTRMSLANPLESGPLENEVAYYPSGPTASDWRIRNFDSFGGWVATMIDLCRWSVRFDNISSTPDNILSMVSEATMWEPGLNGTYAKGWIVNPLWRGHNGAFDGTGSFFTQRIDSSNISFAVVMNTDVSPDKNTGYSGLWNAVNSMISSVSAWPSYDLF